MGGTVTSHGLPDCSSSLGPSVVLKGAIPPFALRRMITSVAISFAFHYISIIPWPQYTSPAM